MMKSYSEMLQYNTYSDRFNYLKLNGVVGKETFGFDRYLNQKFYTSTEWKNIRNEVILRDKGNNLGLNGFTIYNGITVHHMNPITIEDILENREKIFNPDFLICTSYLTHRSIHFGEISNEFNFVERKKGDTKLW